VKFSGFVLSALMSTMAIASCSNDQSFSETFVTTTSDTATEVARGNLRFDKSIEFERRQWRTDNNGRIN